MNIGICQPSEYKQLHVPTSPVNFVLCGCQERKLVQRLISCYVDTAVLPRSIAKKLFHPTTFFFFFILFLGAQFITLKSVRSPVVSGGATGFTRNNVISLWKGETELGLLTAGNGGLVQAESW